ncbi:MAG: type II secretion system minor pseudopilin GspI [Gammaproteobacteria bacterium]
MRRRQPGFTLIEVLIALALVASALGGALALVRTAIDNQDYLERRLYATWIATNLASEFRLEPQRFGPRERDGNTTMMGRRFDWSVDVVEPTEETAGTSPTLPRRTVTVRVGDTTDAVLADLTFSARPIEDRL